MRHPSTSGETRTAGHGSRLRPVCKMLALLYLGTAQLAWALPGAPTPLAVSLLQSDGAIMQLRLRAPAGEEPVRDRSGAAEPAPYKLVLTWAVAGAKLDGELPVLPAKGLGPLQALTVRNSPGEGRLELQLNQAVAQAGGTGRQSANAAPGPEVLLLDVTINDQRLNDVVRVEQLPSGRLLIPADAWTEARLLPLPQTFALGDGSPAYALDAVTGATYNIDRQKQTLVITVPATAFVGATLAMQDALNAPPPRPQPGVMVNYDVAASHSGGLTTGGATLEAVAFSPLGNLVVSGVVADTGRERYANRLDTYWRYDLPQRMESLILGDAVGVSSGWSQPVRFGGIRWGRNFGLRPGFITYPQLSLAGQAALPSTVEILVNNLRQSSQSVQPGPFDLTHVPITTGAGEVNLVVRDLLGRETVVQQSYYVAPNMLAAGLSDFSFEAGWLRTSYGRTARYENPFGAGTWRQGLSDSLTGEVRLEVQADRQAAGLAMGSLLGTWAVGYAGLAASRSKTQGPSESGQLIRLGIDRSSPQGGGSLQYEQASRGFAPFGETVGPLAALMRPRERWLASVGAPLWGGVSGWVNYVQQTRWDGDSVKGLRLSLSMPAGQRGYATASLDKRLSGDKGLRAFVTLNFPLENGIFTSAQVSRGSDGQLSGTVSAERAAPTGPGLGWRVQAAGSGSQNKSARAGLQYNTNQAEMGLEVAAAVGGQVAARAGARGTVGWVDQMLFASRPVGEDSVAVVKIAGVEGVPVMRANQVIAVTDSRGLAFVPGLSPWQRNTISIDTANLPLDVDVANTTHDVTPYARTGVVVDLGARRSRQATLVLRQADGTPVPIGARVRLLPAGPEFVAGRRGEVWLTDLAEKTQRVQVTWPKGGCTLTLEVPASPDGTPGKIGPLACEGNTP